MRRMANKEPRDDYGYRDRAWIVSKRRGETQKGGESQLLPTAILPPAPKVIQRREPERSRRDIQHYGIAPDHHSRHERQEGARPTSPRSYPTSRPSGSVQTGYH